MDSFPVAGLFVLVFVIVGIAISIAILAFWIWSLISVAVNPAIENTERIFWFVFIFATGVLGSLIYLVAGRSAPTSRLNQKTANAYPMCKQC